MKKIPRYNKTDHPPYLSYSSTVVLAMFVANLHILYQGKCFDITGLTPKVYFIAVVANMCICLILVQLIIRLTAYLDVYYPWKERCQKRIKMQLLLGFFVPVLLTLCIIIWYFVLREIKIHNSCYFNRYLHQIVIMSLLLNIYLFTRRDKTSKLKVTKKDVQPIKEPTSELYEAIACIYIEQKNYFSISLKGEKMGWDYTLSESMTFLPSIDFYPIKHSFIVNKLAILKVNMINAKKTKIVLIAPINLEIEISQRENVGFKRWYAKMNSPLKK